MNQNTTETTGERMGPRKIPLPVILVACLYLAVGIGGLVVHFSDRQMPDWIWIEATESLAIVCGVFVLRAHNWARWLAAAWMAFHVVISFGEWGKLAVHGLFLVLIVWCLFRPGSNRFFKNTRAA